MDYILLPILPKSCANIATGDQSIIVKKNKPKVHFPFKCYIYCTKCRQFDSLVGSLDTLFYYPELNHIVCLADMERDSIGADILNGKVIGEFVCNQIDSFTTDFQDNPQLLSEMIEKSLLSLSELVEYKANASILYGWHISELSLYEKPKDLSDFEMVDHEKIKSCKWRKRTYQEPDYNPTGGLIYGGVWCEKTSNWCDNCYKKPLQKVPSPWGYVEERKNV